MYALQPTSESKVSKWRSLVACTPERRPRVKKDPATKAPKAPKAPKAAQPTGRPLGSRKAPSSKRALAKLKRFMRKINQLTKYG